MKTILWVDDFRNPCEFLTLMFGINPIEYNIVWVKNYEEFVNYINLNIPDIVCFDHDLGEEMSGYDCAKYLVDVCINDNWRVLPTVYSQSSNPVGKTNIICYCENYNKQLI